MGTQDSKCKITYNYCLLPLTTLFFSFTGQKSSSSSTRVSEKRKWSNPDLFNVAEVHFDIPSVKTLTGLPLGVHVPSRLRNSVRDRSVYTTVLHSNVLPLRLLLFKQVVHLNDSGTELKTKRKRRKTRLTTRCISGRTDFYRG